MAPRSRLWTKFKSYGWRVPTPPPFATDCWRYLKLWLAWMPVAIFIKQHVVDITFISGPSMAPFFNERHNETTWRDVCLAWKVDAQHDLQRGMVITFR